MKRALAGNCGFTLLELLIAVAVFSLLATGLAALLRAGIQIKERTQRHQNQAQVAGLIFEDISTNLRNGVSLGTGEFQGTRHEMAFTVRKIAWQQDSQPVDWFRRMIYRYDSGAGRILKTETDPRTALSLPHLLCEDGAGLRFEYRTPIEETGTREWVSDWSGEAWPSAVRVELVFGEATGRMDVWSRVVSVPRVETTVEEQE